MADCNHADSDRLGACIVGVSGVSRGECGRDIGFCLHHCGHLFQAESLSGYIDANQEVVVVKVLKNKIIVKLKSV